MSILVVSPHPDDETLGACGLLLKAKDNGEKIYWLIITDMKEEYGFEKEKIQKRNEEIQEVRIKYNFDAIFNLKLRPSFLDQYNEADIITQIAQIINTIKPNTVILPNKSDVHSDHKKVFDWCYSCTKIFRYQFIKKILTMEILSETDFAPRGEKFIPNYFVDISDYIDRKVDILKIYKSELGEHPFPRSVEGIISLAKLRGISAGVKYAEAFEILKLID